MATHPTGSRQFEQTAPAGQSANVRVSMLLGLTCVALFWAGLGCAAAHTTDLPAVGPASNSRGQKPEEAAPRDRANESMLDLVRFNVTLPADSQVTARIRATVNNVPILDEDVKEMIFPFFQATQALPEPERTTRRNDAFKQTLQQLIEQEVILQDMYERLKDRAVVLDRIKDAARKESDKRLREIRRQRNLKSDDELKCFLRQQGMSIPGIRRQFERSFLASTYMREKIHTAIDRVGQERIREYYLGHPEEFQIQDSVVWQDIFIDAQKYPSRDAARQVAEHLVAKARAGEDFLQLVKAHDNGDSSYRNGEGYGRRRGEIKPTEVERHLFQMTDGEIGPLVELPSGFHVIRLVKREYAGLKPFDAKTQQAIRNKLQMEAFEKEYKKVVADLKRKASIEISRSVD